MTTHCFQNIVIMLFIPSIIDKIRMEKREESSTLQNTITKNESDKRNIRFHCSWWFNIQKLLFLVTIKPPIDQIIEYLFIISINEVVT